MAVLGDGRTSALAYRSSPLSPTGGGRSVDGAHCAFVMKKVKGPAQAELGRATRRWPDILPSSPRQDYDERQ